MKWLNDFTLVMRSSITTLREKIEDPERMLHQLVVDMEEELEHVRHSVAEAIADEIQLRKRVERTRKETEEWLERAQSALKRNDETASKSALEQKVLAEQRAESLGKEHEKQKDQTHKLQSSVHDLEDKIRQARQKRTVLLARLTRADSTRRINNALDRTGNQSAFTQFNKLESRVDRAEAVNEAYDRLDGKDPDADELQRQFEEDDRRDQIENEFEELKKRVGPQA